MKIKIYKKSPTSESLISDSRLAQTTDAMRVQFGDEIIEVINDAEIDESSRSIAIDEHADDSEIQLRNHEQYDSSWVHLVLQKGRLFNMEYPMVPVLYDRGRFQLVAIDPDEAKALFDCDVCFSIQALENQKVVFDQPSATERLPQITPSEQALVDSVDKDQFLAILRRLTGFINRHTLSNNYMEVTQILRQELIDLDYETAIEPIDIFDRRGQFVGKSSNLIAQKLAQNNPGPGLILVTAHLDSVNLQNQFDDSLIAPGADDNGSGSAGVLEIARVFSRFSGRHDIKFVLFGGEEQNLFGSNAHVKNMCTEDRDRLLAVVNMDMIGVKNSSPSTVLIEGASVSRSVIDGLAIRAALHTDLVVRTSENPFASDHVPFINEGLPAVLTIEGDDSQNSTIHTSEDIIELINVDYAEKILKMNVGYIASLMLESD